MKLPHRSLRLLAACARTAAVSTLARYAAPATVCGAPCRRVLCLGDGDLSYSLALRRCFGEQIELTATTLLSEAELTSTYTRAAAILAELRERGVDVRFEVDATALALGPADLIIFSFPHLGLTDLSDEALAARRHGVLLAHFFASAAPLLADGGRVHLTLSGNHPTSWRVAEHAARNGLRIARAAPPSASKVSSPSPSWSAAPVLRKASVERRRSAGAPPDTDGFFPSRRCRAAASSDH